MRRASSVIKGAVKAFGYFSGWLVVLMMLLVLVEVFMRYVLKRAPMVADEFGGYMLVAIAFLGAAYTWQEKGHVRITALVSRLPSRMASWTRLIVLILVFVCVAVLIQGGYHFVAFSFRMHLRSSSWLVTPLQVPQMAILLGFILMALALFTTIVESVKDIRLGKNVEKETKIEEIVA